MTTPTGLWAWAARAYARPDVAALCLRLQDQDGQSVCLMLWAAWMAAEGRPAAHELLISGAALARAWETEVIAPLRGVRRRLKGRGADALRDQVKVAELKAEQVLLQELEALAPAPDASRSLAEALEAATGAWGAPAASATLRLLAAALA